MVDGPSRYVVEHWAGDPSDYVSALEYAMVIEAVLESGTDDRRVWTAARDRVIRA